MILDMSGPPERAFNEGDVLFQEGAAAEALFVIKAGKVAITRQVDGMHAVLAELQAGDFVGEVGLVTGQPHGVTATAQEPTRVLVVQSWQLEAMVTQNPEIAVRVLAGLAARLHDIYNAVGCLGPRDPRERLVRALQRHAATAETVTDKGILIEKRLADIGKEVALSEEELGDASKSLMKSKAMRVQKNGVLIPKLEQLNALAGSFGGQGAS